MEIDKNIIAEATKCNVNIACLNDENHVLCKISECISNDVHFLKCDSNNKNCKYKTSFGFQLLCSCPVRKAIYNEHGV